MTTLARFAKDETNPIAALVAKRAWTRGAAP
jgi:hypothetical protein